MCCISLSPHCNLSPNVSLKRNCWETITSSCCHFYIFLYCFPETYKTRNVFSEARFLYLNKRKKETEQPLISQRGRDEKNSHEAIYAHLHQRKHLSCRVLIFLVSFLNSFYIWFHYFSISLFYYSQLQFHLTKLLDTLDEDRQGLGVYKSKRRFRWWRRQYFSTRGKFFWCL